MNDYIILLRQMKRRAGRTERVSLEPAVVGGIAESNGVQLLDILACTGMFDAVLLCRAPDSPTLARLLEALEGWHTDALLATSHIRHDSFSEALGQAPRTSTRLQ